MEVLIDCYFDRLFSEMERSCLASRYKRRELVSYFTDVINSCAEGINKIYDINVLYIRMFTRETRKLQMDRFENR